MTHVSISQIQALQRLFEYEQPGHLAATLLEAREQLIHYALRDDDCCGSATHIANQIDIIRRVARTLKAFDTTPRQPA